MVHMDEQHPAVIAYRKRVAAAMEDGKRMPREIKGGTD